MNQDVHPKLQDDQSYRFALNAVLETREGNHGAISNELGNDVCGVLPEDKIIIGHTLTDTEDIVIFLFDPALVRPEHEIGIYNPILCTYTTIAKDDCLNFSDKYQINALFRIRNGCERIIYFTDNLNPYRVANITDTSDWVNPLSLAIIDCGKISFSRDLVIPCFSLKGGAKNDSGGSLEVGTYSMVARYLDYEENPTDWIVITQPIAIGNGSFKTLTAANTYTTYDGGSNVVGSIGYVNKTNKSITFSISNVDTRFKFLQVAAIKRTGDEGEITGVDVLYPVPILPNGLAVTTTLFTYTGNGNQIQSETTLDEVLSERQRIDKVKAHAQLDSKLFLAAVTNTDVDYTGFQRHASTTKVEYIKRSVAGLNNQPKSPEYYFEDNSFLGDEVYPIGQVYVFRNGTISPTFHIPGRAPNTITGTNPYITVFTNWDTDDVTGDANIYNPAKTKRWQVYNTATKYASPYAGTDVSGLMGYHETTTNYPSMNAPCDEHADGYWGRDWQGNLLTTSTKIRHHRMPSSELVNGAVTTDHYNTGVRFTMTQNYPHPDIVGHYYVYGDRTFEKTIVDKGILSPLKKHTNPSTEQLFTIFFTNREDGTVSADVDVELANVYSTYMFTSPRTLFEDTFSLGTYIRAEKYTAGTTNSYTVVADSERFQKPINYDPITVTNFTTYTNPSQFNYLINWSSFLNKSSDGSLANSVYIPAESKTAVNPSTSNNWLLLTLNSKLTPLVAAPTTGWDAKGFAVSIKADVDVFANLFNIDYKRIGNCMSVKNAGVTHTLNTYSGDTFSSRLGLVDFKYSRTGSGTVRNATDFIYTMIESDYMNGEFRHGDTKTNGEDTYFQWDQISTLAGATKLAEYMSNKYYEIDIGASSYFYPEKYHYNKSFSYLDSISRYQGVPFNYEFCNTCRETFPYRIFHTDVDNAEQSYDYYRIVQPNNYKDLDGATGPIHDLFINFNRLYALTSSSIYHIPIKAQQLQTDEATIYLGTGEVFSIAPEQLKTTDYQFGGSRFFKSRVITEYGTVYVDDFSGRPFLLDNQLNDITLNNGIRNFWQENGILFFDEQFYQQTGEHYPNISTSSTTGIGYLSTYDPRFKRLIIHKKDFKLLPQYLTTFEYSPDDVVVTPNVVWFDDDNFYVNDASGNETIITFDNVAYFENKSFTLSYSFLTRNWVSFHSYLPYYFINNYDTFFSFETFNDNVYKHSIGNYQTYYGIKYPHILDMVILGSPQEEKEFTNIYYSSSTEIFDNTTQQFRNHPSTFNAAIMYNSTQSTGANLLRLKDSLFQTETTSGIVLVDKTDNKYRISNFRDTVINPNEPLWTSNWANLQTTPFIYIDKIPNIANLNPTVSLYERGRFRDYYLGLRLIYSSTDNVKIATDIVNTFNLNRAR